MNNVVFVCVQFESEEHPRLLSRSQSWVRKLKERFPKRNYIVMTCSVCSMHASIRGRMCIEQ